MQSQNNPLVRQGWIRVVIFCISYLVLFITAGSVYAWVEQAIQPTAQDSLLLGFILSCFFSLLAVYLFRKGIDLQSFSSLGLHFRRHGRDAVAGLVLAIALLVGESFILYATGHLVFTGSSFNGRDLLYGLLIMILVAISEEVVFRGYILNNLLQSVNRWIALAITSLLFALFHAANPNITTLALINIFLSGFVIGLSYLYTRNLWFAICFHFSWNFFLGPVSGYEVSGLPLNSVLQQTIQGPRWLTGGEFGLEGSILDGIFSIIAFSVMLMVYERRFREATAET